MALFEVLPIFGRRDRLPHTSFKQPLRISNIIEKAIIDENAAYVFINNITMLILKYLP